MDPNTTALPPLTTYQQVAKMIDHSLVRPDLTNDQMVQGLELARRYHVASVSVRPCDIDLAVRLLEGSDVRPGSVSGFPHGTPGTATKLYETRDLLRRGAKEVDMVINYSRLLSREFQYVQTELLQMAEACRKEGAVLKVILETHYLTTELKIIACQCCERADVHFVKTSTGFAPTGCTDEDLKLMRKYVPEDIGVKAAGGIRTLDRLFEVHQLGATRIGATATAAILDEWKARLSAKADAAPSKPAASD